MALFLTPLRAHTWQRKALAAVAFAFGTAGMHAYMNRHDDKRQTTHDLTTWDMMGVDDKKTRCSDGQSSGCRVSAYISIRWWWWYCRGVVSSS
ncbi:hypothetical protein IWX90DRAFT_443456 [Phyllosticta citrichinensis]|uniref:Uncharacterized protein n=1 Tax=Phyllosticta citrichinensis TaxID=1130410 RepID=A0ABR1XJ13_9PEZI